MKVLILVLVEVGFKGVFNQYFDATKELVLILVLVEVGFKEHWSNEEIKSLCGLNPCFSGSWFQRMKQLKFKFDLDWS